MSTKLSKAQISYFFFRITVLWSTSSAIERILSVIMYSSSNWLANFFLLKKLECFQKRLKWIFGSTFPKCGHSLLRDIFDNKYLFDPSNYNQRLPLREKQRIPSKWLEFHTFKKTPFSWELSTLPNNSTGTARDASKSFTILLLKPKSIQSHSKKSRAKIFLTSYDILICSQFVHK